MDSLLQITFNFIIKRCLYINYDKAILAFINEFAPNQEEVIFGKISLRKGHKPKKIKCAFVFGKKYLCKPLNFRTLMDVEFVNDLNKKAHEKSLKDSFEDEYS